MVVARTCENGDRKAGSMQRQTVFLLPSLSGMRPNSPPQTISVESSNPVVAISTRIFHLGGAGNGSQNNIKSMAAVSTSGALRNCSERSEGSHGPDRFKSCPDCPVTWPNLETRKKKRSKTDPSGMSCVCIGIGIAITEFSVQKQSSSRTLNILDMNSEV